VTLCQSLGCQFSRSDSPFSSTDGTLSPFGLVSPEMSSESYVNWTWKVCILTLSAASHFFSLRRAPPFLTRWRVQSAFRARKLSLSLLFVVLIIFPPFFDSDLDGGLFSPTTSIGPLPPPQRGWLYQVRPDSFSDLLRIASRHSTFRRSGKNFFFGTIFQLFPLQTKQGQIECYEVVYWVRGTFAPVSDVSKLSLKRTLGSPDLNGP